MAKIKDKDEISMIFEHNISEKLKIAQNTIEKIIGYRQCLMKEFDIFLYSTKRAIKFPKTINESHFMREIQSLCKTVSK